MRIPRSEEISAEKLAYWYFRLNGCLMIENFVVNPDDREGQRTDADLIGLRFPYRSELIVNPMKDDAIFEETTKPFLFVAEVKLLECELNGPWTKPIKRNLQRVLQAIGAFPPEKVEEVADVLYQSRRYTDDNFDVRMIAVGNSVNERYQREGPDVVQINWDEILRFIYQRFDEYRYQKADHKQWDCVGHVIWDMAIDTDEDQFVSTIKARLSDGRGNYIREATTNN